MLKFFRCPSLSILFWLVSGLIACYVTEPAAAFQSDLSLASNDVIQRTRKCGLPPIGPGLSSGTGGSTHGISRFNGALCLSLGRFGSNRFIDTALFFSSGSDESADLKGISETKSTNLLRVECTNSGERMSLTSLYRIGQYLFGLVGFTIFLMPDRSMTTLLASKVGGAGGYGMASGLCHILTSATEHGRLNSDTYKRLNIGLLGFCLLGMAAVPGEAAFSPSPGAALTLNIVFSTIRLYGATIAYSGWRIGVADSPEQTRLSKTIIWRELINGSKATIVGLKVHNAKKALTYRNCLLLVTAGLVSSFLEGIFMIRYRTAFQKSWFDVSLQWSAVARLFMISTMIATLKDAAERNRLTGTTFIQLNAMLGCWGLLVACAQSVYPLGFAAYRGIEMFAFSLAFFIKGYKSLIEKQHQLQKSTKQSPL